MADHVGRLDAPPSSAWARRSTSSTGEVKQAPRWIHRTGLEWVFRMAMEPGRLGRRYLKNNPAFVRAIVAHPPRLLPHTPLLERNLQRRRCLSWLAPHVVPLDARIFVAGHRGLVGSAIVRDLEAAGYGNILTASRDQLDLRDQAAVNYWFRANRPDYVYLVAGTVGGIHANNTRPAEFIYDNLMIHATVVHAAHVYGVSKLLYLGSSCIYPRLAEQPITESELLAGPLEPTNEAYAIAKIAGIKLCQSYRRQYGDDFISAMPTNLYGPNDNFDLTSSHVLPALIRKFHDAKVEGRREVEIWGTGAPKRRVPPRRRPRRRVPVPDGAVRRRTAHQRRHRRRPRDPRAGRDGPRRRAPGRGRSRSTRRSPTGRRASCSTSPACASWAGRRRSSSATGSPRRTSWFLDNEEAGLRGVPLAVVA